MGASSGCELTIDINAEGIGVALKKMRELRELSKEEVAHRLRLQTGIIDLMESGSFPGNLPEIFAKGYLKSYARLLQFSEPDILSMLELLKFHSPLYNATPYSTLNVLQSSPHFSYLLTGVSVLIMIALLIMWFEPTVIEILSKWLS